MEALNQSRSVFTGDRDSYGNNRPTIRTPVQIGNFIVARPLIDFDVVPQQINARAIIGQKLADRDRPNLGCRATQAITADGIV